MAVIILTNESLAALNGDDIVRVNMDGRIIGIVGPTYFDNPEQSERRITTIENAIDLPHDEQRYPTIGQIFYTDGTNEDIIFVQKINNTDYARMFTTSGREFVHDISTPLNEHGVFYESIALTPNSSINTHNIPVKIKEVHFFETSEK